MKIIKLTLTEKEYTKLKRIEKAYFKHETGKNWNYLIMRMANNFLKELKK